MVRFFRLDAHMLKRVLNAGNTCDRCGAEFKEGDDIVSSYRNRRTRHYHQACYNAMFLEI